MREVQNLCKLWRSSVRLREAPRQKEKGGEGATGIARGWEKGGWEESEKLFADSGASIPGAEIEFLSCGNWSKDFIDSYFYLNERAVNLFLDPSNPSHN